MLTHDLLVSESEPGVRAHKDIPPTVVGHGQLLMKAEGFLLALAPRTGKIRRLSHDMMCMGGLVDPCSPHQGFRSVGSISKPLFF